MQGQAQAQIPAQEGQGQNKLEEIRKFLLREQLPIKVIALGRSRRLAVYVPIKYVRTATYSDGSVVIVMKDSDEDNWDMVKLVISRDSIGVNNVSIPPRHWRDDAIGPVKLRVVELTYNELEVKVVIEVSEP